MRRQHKHGGSSARRPVTARGAPAAAAPARPGRLAAALLAALLLAAAAPAARAVDDVVATLNVTSAVAENQYAWDVIADPPQPLAVRVPANQSAKVTYTVSFDRRLLSTRITVAGEVAFKNRGTKPTIVAGGQVTLCNGYFAEVPTNKGAGAGGPPVTYGCTGSTFSIPLPKSLDPPRSTPGGDAVVPFNGTVTINRIVGAGINSEGLGGPVATAYIDAFMADGGRAVSSPQRFAFDLEPGDVNNRGEMAIAYDNFVMGPIKPLTIFPYATSGEKIPDGLGLKIADSNTYTYTASFRYVEGKTPCNIPLTAVNTQTLYVLDPGDAPLPEPATTVATITFEGCNRKSGGRVGAITAAADIRFMWGLRKGANASAIRVRRGGSGAVRYTVEVRRPLPDYTYSLSGSVFVSPKDGVLGGPPLDVDHVTVFPSAGGSALATCAPPYPDGSHECKFSNVTYPLKGLAPDAGTVRAEITLKDGTVLKVPAEKFDFTSLALDIAKGRMAEVTDTFSGPLLDAAKAAGLSANWDPNKKAPGGTDGVALVIEDARTFDYTVKFAAAKGAKCGAYKLENVARLTPLRSAQKAMVAKLPITVEIYGC